MKKIIIPIFISCALFSCNMHGPQTLVIDKKMEISSAHDELKPSLTRGNMIMSWGMNELNNKWAEESMLTDVKIGVYSKSVIISRWGPPDRVEKSNGIDFLVYSKNSMDANDYALQSLNASRPVTLGYSGDCLVYASAYFLRDGKRLVGDVYYCR